LAPKLKPQKQGPRNRLLIQTGLDHLLAPDQDRLLDPKNLRKGVNLRSLKNQAKNQNQDLLRRKRNQSPDLFLDQNSIPPKVFLI
jgi:hypothetical protein